eukprot:CAMPEP_0114155872 /NCGR_PEP_ID=MMETSP0043_2-20121206/25721_1 /TAXON_ID=464988 /ORGANISM="Hemiselmis andersenii, Strain CCMP644" /LENGTH=271 /DNA_ID=CAMNT_0001251205 /DNA_START=80 /DNA_END=895 /DNA_ORIENTATION=-
MAAIKPASFYPSLMGTLTFNVHTGVSSTEAVATQDLGTANVEFRHYIDHAFLAGLEGGQEMLASLTTPRPPCTELWGTKRMSGNERVVGMLSQPLHVSFKATRADRMIRKSDMYLADVLVIDSLPVPLHVSVQGLEATGAFTSEQEREELYRAASDFSRKPTKELFPEQFHDHPYWGGPGGYGPNTSVLGNIATVGMGGVENLRQELLSARSPDVSTPRVCAACLERSVFCEFSQPKPLPHAMALLARPSSGNAAEPPPPCADALIAIAVQ